MSKFLSALAVAALISGAAYADDHGTTHEEKAVDCSALKEGSKERADCESKQGTDMKEEKKH